MPPSPAVIYLARRWYSIISPYLLVYALKVFLTDRGFKIPGWVSVTASVLAIPIAIVVRNAWREYKNGKDAAKRGAVPLPLVRYKWPMGMDAILQLQRSFSAKFLG